MMSVPGRRDEISQLKQQGRKKGQISPSSNFYSILSLNTLEDTQTPRRGHLVY